MLTETGAGAAAGAGFVRQLFVIHPQSADALWCRRRKGAANQLHRLLRELLAGNQAEATRLLDEHGARRREIDGVGPVLAARILGRTGHVTRFATAAAWRFRSERL
jgi:hypothetical protein